MHTRSLYLLLCFMTFLNAKEVFYTDRISKYFNLDNPFVYSAIGKKYIYEAKEKYQLGNFDTKILAQYNQKEYALSKSSFVSSTIEKPMENGMDLSLQYRKAQGTQEYNNIKTGEEGEVLLGIKIPIFSLLHNTSNRKLNLDLSKKMTFEMDYQGKNNLRLLYFTTVSSYYKLLHDNQQKKLLLNLLNNAKKRATMIKKRVDSGDMAKLSMLEAEQQIIDRKQRLLSIENRYKNALNEFVKYLNISKDEFNNRYTLPSLFDIKENYKVKEVSIKDVIKNRPDLKVLDNEIKKLDLHNKYTAILKYPELNLGLYGLHDLEYENGFKITLGMSFPIQQRKYEAKSLEIKQSIKNIDKLKEQKVISIKTNLQRIENSIETLVNNIENSTIEVSIVKRLEQAENKKYELGSSNLFMVNQREFYSLQVKKKFLKYNLDYLLLQQEREKVIGGSYDF